ncbi:MAG: hypothetical protein NT049_11245, partial [Planctomycetota bacterium]|nr:hypothetical protein [Planctomycetota bacterium]
MSQQASQTEFVSQTTHFYFGAFTFTLAGAFSLVCGLLVLICGWKNRDGTSATMPGIMMTAIGLFTLPLGVHSVFHILARRRPIMRLYREGIEVNKIGASFLEKENEGERVVPKVAQVLRVAWPVFSGQ